MCAPVSEQPCRVLAIGNPLLDLSITIDDPSFLAQYGYSPDSIDMVSADHPIFADVASLNPRLTAGGAAQNSLRVASWVLGGSAAYFGAVGSDDSADVLVSELISDLVTPLYVITDAEVTGKCACVIHGTDRALVATIGASGHIPNGAVRALAEDSRLSDLSVVYSSGFPLVHNEEIAFLFNVLKSRGIVTCCNISALFLTQVTEYRERLLDVMRESLYLFGNDAEFSALTAALDLVEPAELLSLMPKDASLVITAGADHTTVIQALGKTVIPVPIVSRDEIVDTNGCGDAFVGGFLAGLSRGLPIGDCVDLAHRTARAILGVDGVQLRMDPPSL